MKSSERFSAMKLLLSCPSQLQISSDPFFRHFDIDLDQNEKEFGEICPSFFCVSPGVRQQNFPSIA
jgi:hypothetical protein